MRSVAVVLLATLASTAAWAADAAGYWQGAIEVPGLELRVAITLQQEEDRWTGTIDLAEQGLRGLRLTGIEVGEQRAVRFGIPGIPGTPLFDGKISGDGRTFAGDFLQHGERFPFELIKGTAPAASSEDLFAVYLGPGVAGDGFAGKWNGTLRSGPAKLRMSLLLEADENGALSGALHSVDQGDARLDITGVARLDDKLIVEVASIGAVINVRLNDDGAELGGRWEQEQAGIDLPLVLHRQP